MFLHSRSRLLALLGCRGSPRRAALSVEADWETVPAVAVEAVETSGLLLDRPLRWERIARSCSRQPGTTLGLRQDGTWVLCACGELVCEGTSTTRFLKPVQRGRGVHRGAYRAPPMHQHRRVASLRSGGGRRGRACVDDVRFWRWIGHWLAPPLCYTPPSLEGGLPWTRPDGRSPRLSHNRRQPAGGPSDRPPHVPRWHGCGAPCCAARRGGATGEEGLPDRGRVDPLLFADGGRA